MQQPSDEVVKRLSLDTFMTTAPAPAPKLQNTPKAKRIRKTKDAIKQEQINALIAKEHELDAKSKTINIERCFLSELRVANEVWEELRARMIDQLEQMARAAEAKAKRDGRKTILIQDIV